MQKSFFKNKTILITGGTGSLGRALVFFFLEKKFPFKKIIVFIKWASKMMVIQLISFEI